MQWGLDERGCWLPALHSFTKSRELGRRASSCSGFDDPLAPSLALGPKASPLYWSLLCHADPLVLPTAHLWWGRHSRRSGGLASRLFAFKGCPLPPTPFPASFLSTWWQAPLPHSQHLDFPDNWQSSKQALFFAAFVWAHAFFLCHRIPFLYSFVR